MLHNKNKKQGIRKIRKKSNQQECKFEGEKILNVQSQKDLFLSISESFKSILNELVVDSEEISKVLIELQNLITAKLLAFECSSKEEKDGSQTSALQNLLSSKSLASSTQSVCSESSVTYDHLDENDAFKHFLKNVNCPFCFLPQPDKFDLIKHIDENCRPLMTNALKKMVIHYSAFQILPNNMIKCNLCVNSVQKNLSQYFAHTQNKLHVLKVQELSKVKSYSEFLFCSCCKVLVPNNFTQLEFHVSHDIHKSKAINAPNHLTTCVYTKTKKFKCLDCPSKNTYQSMKNILEHFEDPKHQKNMKKEKMPEVFCEFCNEVIHVFKLLSHFNSGSHLDRQAKGIPEGQFEMCYYCGFTCQNLDELSVHMKTRCSEIIYIREQNHKQNLPEKIEREDKSVKDKLTNLAQRQNEKSSVLNKPSFESKKIEQSVTKSTEERTLEGDSAKEDLQIIVIDNTDVAELYKYFKKFGEITSLEIQEGKNVLIEFQEKIAAEDALLLRDVIKINGVKVEITTRKSLIKPGKEMERTKKEDNREESLGHKANIQESDYNSDSDNFNSDDEPAKSNRELDNLFLRVSNHLKSTVKASDSSLEDKILTDCAKIFGQKQCSFCGFRGCRISFPVENITLYCNVLEEYRGETYSAFMSDQYFQKNLLKTYFTKLCAASDEWEGVMLNIDPSFPYIECKHKGTQKNCTFTFMRSAKLLTEMLRCYVENVNGVEQVCLIIRFWISVHELNVGDFEYAIISLLIFFFMNQNLIPGYSVDHLLQTKALSFFTAVRGQIGYKPPVSGIRPPASESVNVMEMFQTFLKLLLKIDFTKNAICVPINYPVPKEIFQKYPCSSLLDFLDPERLMDSPMCVLDPELRTNLTARINGNDLKSLLEAARYTLKNTK